MKWSERQMGKHHHVNTGVLRHSLGSLRQVLKPTDAWTACPEILIHFGLVELKAKVSPLTMPWNPLVDSYMYV